MIFANAALREGSDIVFADHFDEGRDKGPSLPLGFCVPLTAPEDMLNRARETPVIQARDTSRRNSPAETGELHNFKGLGRKLINRDRLLRATRPRR